MFILKDSGPSCTLDDDGNTNEDPTPLTKMNSEIEAYDSDGTIPGLEDRSSSEYASNSNSSSSEDEGDDCDPAHNSDDSVPEMVDESSSEDEEDDCNPAHISDGSVPGLVDMSTSNYTSSSSSSSEEEEGNCKPTKSNCNDDTDDEPPTGEAHVQNTDGKNNTALDSGATEHCAKSVPGKLQASTISSISGLTGSSKDVKGMNKCKAREKCHVHS